MFLHQSEQPSSVDTWVPMTHEWSCSRQIPKFRIVLAHGLYYWYTVYIYVHDTWFIACHWRADSWQLTVLKTMNLLKLVNARRQPDWISGQQTSRYGLRRLDIQWMENPCENVLWRSAAGSADNKFPSTSIEGNRPLSHSVSPVRVGRSIRIKKKHAHQ